MKKPLLDVRLATVKEQIEPCDIFADIGSDHAYLPICLLTEGIVRKAYITDVRRGPLANSRKNAQKYGVSGRCEFLLGDGLAVLQDKPVDILSVCGMGAETICAMLRDGREWLAGLNYMVLQPMTQAEVLRRYLHAAGYGIFRECIVKDGHNYYQIICATAREPDGAQVFGNVFDYEFPPYLIARKDDTMYDFLHYRLDVETEILANMSGSVCGRSKEVTAKIAYIKERINDYDTCRNH